MTSHKLYDDQQEINKVNKDLFKKAQRSGIKKAPKIPTNLKTRKLYGVGRSEFFSIPANKYKQIYDNSTE